MPWSQGKIADAIGDAYPGDTPQKQEDFAMNEPMPMGMDAHEYKFVVAHGQVHVSPVHSHDELIGHAGQNPASDGPTAVGYVNVDHGHATWMVESNMSLRGLHDLLSDYSDTVGWDFEGMVGSDGSHLHDDFGPKMGMWYKYRDDGHLLLSKRHLPDAQRIRIYGKTAYVEGTNLDIALCDWASDYGYHLKLADYPGGGDMLDKMRPHENLDTFNRGDTDFQPERSNPDMPLGDNLKCGVCGRRFDRIEELRLHEKAHEPLDHEEIPDGHFPQIDDFDEPLPFRRRQPTVNQGEAIL